ncbi:glyoxylase-like metal-dependent hydrolase (beta-lactamase superfamily II)/rhodanese-related sulfurtransferase [Mesoflavibacter sabulilitoris]|uniref:MBL fold metallo-hydrolase n=1 Tax=Mesoflavibacter zeaxanthinifaciens subsp. sabulilitoris TaxID=1520893 RepID=A0A2T1NF52_9FLAO|nr:rhodanese-like domain-containing protein [Mesoflavibacter zeaxanthinifaciens]MBB3124843.1 glyoxylase-like metal-dependent hydrolase (beta-lactamase superfamily II)/rhodanese-related sulfurtransferase [Mesoflavibacter zeaxanthinifaciens subsp. sabulilitoris]PSG91067.1 MBL fold metallo-hydrolase [Mesoflavibacter zeaxanthinifaciens subsp. sabulilitoris]
MNITQFEDKPLAHYSYAIISDNKMAIVDPSRDPKPYYKLAEKENAKIVAVFETHPHADFVSSHFQIHKETGATIFVSKLVGANYPHKTFDDGDVFNLGSVQFSAINTPGHSPDSITIIAKNNADYAMFSGDTLFIGDVGRPDLREKAGNMKAKREELAKSMYQTMQTKFNDLPDNTIVYPAHGAGSLCGKNMSKDASSTLGREREENWAFKNLSEDDFVNHILKDQPFIPSYFGYNVDINKVGAKDYEKAISEANFQFKADSFEDNALIIDVRDEADFKKNHLKGSINIMAKTENDKFETWLGSIVKPKEAFYVVLNSVEDKDEILHRTAKIGYEDQLQGILTLDDSSFESTEKIDLSDFKNNPNQYTIIDIRNKSEVEEGKFFENAISIPLNELRDSENQIPTEKPIVVHCAGGYRSAAGSSIISNLKNNAKVYDLSEAVSQFK